MRYKEIQPNNSLARFIECFWTLDGDSNSAPTAPESILPDGCVELILNFGTPFSELRDNGKQELQPPHFLVGQMTQPVFIKPAGSVQLLGIRFHPGGTAPFFRIPMSRLTNQIIDLGSLDAVLERDLLNAAASAATLPDKIAAIEKYFTHHARNFGNNPWLVDLAAGAVQLGGRVSIDRLASTAGISGRQLERRFLNEVGIGPKLLCRILRFQHVFRSVADNSAGWAAVAVDCGYYDQAHLIRDFQEFARQTPAVLMAQRGRLTEAFTRRNR